MTDKLKAAAEMALEELAQIKYGLERNRVWGGMEWSYVPIHPTQYLPLRDKLEAQIAALRQALDQLPDTTEMIEPEELVCICGAIWQGHELICPPKCLEEGIEREMPIDRGAWDDVPDATKWVDELRGGDDDWDHPPQRDCDCKNCTEYWSDVYPNKGNLCGND